MHSFYRKFISPSLHFAAKIIFANQHGCRYSPTCSEYSRQAIKKYGIIAGGNLAIKRILSCHPYSKRPYLDPVP